METAKICQHCGKPIGPKAVGGLCPECLLKVGLGTSVAPEGGAGGAGEGESKRFVSPPVEELAKHFPQLEILELLGQGGMGAVYKARQLPLDRLVALKILPPRPAGDPGFAERFTREARALAKLSHPNIVAVHEFGQLDGLHYFIMEFVDGLNLRQLEQTGKLSAREALQIIPQICEALQFAHDEGIVHRDIKPENVLLDKKGRVKIADFGIAKLLGKGGDARLTGAKDVVGTPHYMAPEQVEHPETVDHRADIYSLGVVFYEMLTGELPLGKFQPPSKKVQVDVRLDEIVLHTLEKEPERRYQHARQVKTDVETVVASPGSAERLRAAPSVAARLPGVVVVRWTARVLGTLLLAFYGLFVLGEGLPAIGSQPLRVQLGFLGLGLMSLGFVIGWKREGVAALLIASGCGVWHIGMQQIRWNLFQTPLPVAALYGYFWWASCRIPASTKVIGRSWKTGVLIATAGLGATVGIGLLAVLQFHPRKAFAVSSVPPVVVSTLPESGSTQVDPGLSELRVTFSKPMQDGNWSWTTWGEENFPELTGSPRYLADGRTCVLPVKLKPGKLYATWLNSEYHKNFSDRDGRAALPYLLIFETRK